MPADRAAVRARDAGRPDDPAQALPDRAREALRPLVTGEEVWDGAEGGSMPADAFAPDGGTRSEESSDAD